MSDIFNVPGAVMTGASSTDFTILGMYVDRKRILARLSVGEVARICSIPPDDVNRAIRGRSIGPDSLHALCDWLDRAPSFFDTHSLATRREVFP
ncbi:hypothetical protein [Brucella sp. NBRC 113783]|uniref:hypothetical protein n=1 Tax=Brucella sp. NBRC 113783 TaxID=3075478 RepID=UPI0029BFE3D6|nr:hypothetical protein [Brucella sp. NBRC 113783]MDX4074805.1 hypothetical protein [Brucella sp. NBRC 113783]